jgi:hypothetical protein
VTSIKAGSYCTTRAGAQYRVKSISSTGVATLVTDSGSFAMCSHVSVLQTIQTTQCGIASNPKTLPERLQWMADNLPGFKEELEAVRDIQRLQFSKCCVSAAALAYARAAAETQHLAASSALGNPALNPDSFANISVILR